MVEERLYLIDAFALILLESPLAISKTSSLSWEAFHG
jgi:hypothetical protein